MPATPRPRDDKFNERRAELGQATLETLATLGYARTSLREIAQNSPYSHGVLHYYFSDKVDLILCSVRQYKAVCVTRYDKVTVDATSYAELLARFCDKMAETLRDETSMHRLWYDLRSQAMFEEALREDVLIIDKSLENMIWRVLARFAELAGAPVRASSETAYAMFDGVFQHALQKYVAGDAKGKVKALEELEQNTALLVRQLIEEPKAAPAPKAEPAPKAKARAKAVRH